MNDYKKKNQNEKVSDFRQSLANMFINLLEEKPTTWKKEWSVTSPFNPITNTRYKGVNRFVLQLTQMKKGYSDPRWVTFVQIADKDKKYHPKQEWKLKKGAKATEIMYAYPFNIEEKKAYTWEEYNLAIINNESKDSDFKICQRFSNVFNASMVEGIEPYKEPVNHDEEICVDELITTLSKNMVVPIVHGGNRACYIPSLDEIHLPPIEAFTSNNSYNSTALHELAHSTGAEKRLNRNIHNIFGSSDYAFEELVAEISACFMSESLQIPENPKIAENHKAYVQGWVKELKDKPEALIKAVNEAQKVADYMDYQAGIITVKEYSKHKDSQITVNDDTGEILPNKKQAKNKPKKREAEER